MSEHLSAWLIAPAENGSKHVEIYATSTDDDGTSRAQYEANAMVVTTYTEPYGLRQVERTRATIVQTSWLQDDVTAALAELDRRLGEYGEDPDA